MKRLSQSVPLDSDRLPGFGHKVPEPLRCWYMTKSDGEQGRWGGDVSVLIHPSRHSTILGPVSLRDSKQEREEKGCGGLLGERHRAGAVRPATQVAQNTNFAPRTRAPPGGDFLRQLLLLPTLLVTATCQTFPKLSQIKQTRNQFRGAEYEHCLPQKIWHCWVVLSSTLLELEDAGGTNRWYTALLRCEQSCVQNTRSSVSVGGSLDYVQNEQSLGNENILNIPLISF